MGRGLSDIQSTILRLAYQKRVQRDRNREETRELRIQLKKERGLLERDMIVYHSAANKARRKELIDRIRHLGGQRIYGTLKTNTDLSHHEVLVNHWGWRPAKEGTLNQRFSKAQLGEKHYNTALASLSRAVARLEKRGLVVRQRATIDCPPGIDLTDRGLEEAGRLT